MLKFKVYQGDEPATSFSLRSAHLLGADDVGVRAAISFDDGQVVCDKGAIGPASLCLQFELDELGELMLQTCLLPERDEPYLLTLELARHRLMRVIAKQEDWAMFELSEDSPARKRVELAKRCFVEALCNVDEPARAERLAKQSLMASIDASEELALAHAELFLQRRLAQGNRTRNTFGCGVSLEFDPDRLGPLIIGNFDFVRLPMPWRVLEPSEQEYNWQPLDKWCEWAHRNKMPIVAGPIVSFTPDVVPDWLYIWEHDYDTVRDLLYEHIERLVNRYRNVVTLWNVVSGVHVNNHFTFNFEQLMDLTRMSVMLTKKVHPTARTLIEITHPFGEYYANNQRSIPPMMYSEMVVQSGIPFDGFGLKLVMGKGDAGQCMRDLMSVSALIDRFNGLGKPVHITSAAVPSAIVELDPDQTRQASSDNGDPPHSGYWRKPWSKTVQSHWVEAFYNVTLSKPFVESVAWLELADHAHLELPAGGLVDEKLHPKAALKRITSLRRSFQDHS